MRRSAHWRRGRRRQRAAGSSWGAISVRASEAREARAESIAISQSLSSVRDPGFAIPGGEHEVVEEVGRELRPAGDPGLLVDSASMLPHGALAPPRQRGDLLVAVTLEEHERDLALRWR